MTDNLLDKSVMGFPIWMVAILGAGAYFIVKRFKSNSSGSPTILTTVPNGGSGAANGATTGSSISSNSSSPLSSLESWISNAQNALQNLGYDTIASNSALQDYVAGNGLTATEYGIINAAQRLIGSAPGIGSPTLANTLTGNNATTSNNNSNSNNNTTSNAPTSSPNPIVNKAVSKVQQVYSQTTGLAMNGFTTLNGQTLEAGVPTQVTNPSAPGYNPYQKPTASEIQQASTNILNQWMQAGLTQSQAQQHVNQYLQNVSQLP